MRQDLKLGIDKSQWDGHFDWAVSRVRGIEWATIRAAPGNSTPTDPLYGPESEAALAAGVAVSPYQFYKPRKGWKEQADLFLSVATHANLPPTLDLENFGLTYAYVGIGKAEIKPWLERVESATGVRPWIYTSVSYIKSYLTAETWLQEYDLILANYDVAAPYVPKPFTPKNLIAWQFGDGRDARYYGALQANGAALYVHYGDLPLKGWVAAPVPSPAVPTSGVARTTLRVRSGPATTFQQIGSVSGGTSVQVFEVVVENGNTWVRIGTGQWACASLGTQILIDLA